MAASAFPRELAFDLVASTTSAVAAAAAAAAWNGDSDNLLRIVQLAAFAGAAKAALRCGLVALYAAGDAGLMFILRFATTVPGFLVVLTTIVTQWFMPQSACLI